MNQNAILSDEKITKLPRKYSQLIYFGNKGLT